MFSTNVTIFHHLISQAGWNRCNLSIYLSVMQVSIPSGLLSRARWAGASSLEGFIALSYWTAMFTDAYLACFHGQGVLVTC